MTRVITNPCQLFDHLGYPRQCPQVRGVTIVGRPLSQRRVQQLPLLQIQTRLAAGTTRLAKASHPLRPPRVIPAPDALPTHPEQPPYRRLALSTLAKQLRRTPATRFQPVKVPTRPKGSFHAFNISGEYHFVNVLYENL